MRPRATVLAGAVALACLAACTEAPQTNERGAAGKRADAPPWASAEVGAFAAPGWKGGDQAAWTQQIRQRGQAQNDYVR